MYHKVDQTELNEIFVKAEKQLFNSELIKFKKCKDWRKINVPAEAGIYAVFENKDNLLYIGESDNLRERMNEMNRTVNHSFRKQLGYLRFKGIKSSKKFANGIEIQLDKCFESNLFVSFLPVNFGRLEIETFLVTKHQERLINSVKKRK